MIEVNERTLLQYGYERGEFFALSIADLQTEVSFSPKV